MVKFNLQPGYGCGISEVSCFPNEKEMLLPPYTPMRLRNKTDDVLEYDVGLEDGETRAWQKKWETPRPWPRSPAISVAKGSPSRLTF